VWAVGWTPLNNNNNKQLELIVGLVTVVRVVLVGVV